MRFYSAFFRTVEAVIITHDPYVFEKVILATPTDRTCDRRIRNPMLYPAELRALEILFITPRA